MSYYQPDPALSRTSEQYRPAARNILGVVSFAVGLATVLVSMLRSLGLIVLVGLAGSALPYTLVNIVGMSLEGILGAVALVLGIVALLRRGAPKGFAGAGTALGGQAVFFLLLSLVENAVISWR